MYQTIRYEKQENIGIITIDRPEALNALNSTVILELIDVIGQVEQDGELTSVSSTAWTWPPAANGASGAVL